jgi:hypothetical protein
VSYDYFLDAGDEDIENLIAMADNPMPDEAEPELTPQQAADELSRLGEEIGL